MRITGRGEDYSIISGASGGEQGWSIKEAVIFGDTRGIAGFQKAGQCKAWHPGQDRKQGWRNRCCCLWKSLEKARRKASKKENGEK